MLQICTYTINFVKNLFIKQMLLQCTYSLFNDSLCL